MATWIAPIDSETDPDAPLTSSLAKRWDNNVIAMTEGASGAPKVQDGALSTTVTTAGQSWVTNRLVNIADTALSAAATSVGSLWVRNRVALSVAGDVGTYAMLSVRLGTALTVNYLPGDTLPGSSLGWASASGTFTGAPAGTWRCMGFATSTPATDTSPARVTMWLRIS